MPFNSTINTKALSSFSLYKAAILKDLKALKLNESIDATWSKQFQFETPKPGKPILKYPLVFVGAVPSNVITAATGRGSKMVKGGSIARIDVAKWVTDADALKDALSKLKITALEKVASLDKYLEAANAPAEPAWHAKWDEKKKKCLDALRNSDEPLKTLAAKAESAFTAGRDAVVDEAYEAALKKVEAGILKTASDALKKGIDELEKEFNALKDATRKPIVEKMEKLLAQQKTVPDLVEKCGTLVAALKMVLEEELTAQRKPTRAEWCKLLEISGSYICRPSGKTVVIDGETYSTHYTISDDSITDRQPNVHGEGVEALLKKVFIDGISSMKQAHATLDWGNVAADYPHLYIDKTYVPKQLPSDDVKSVEDTLKTVRDEMNAWLKAKIATMKTRCG